MFNKKLQKQIDSLREVVRGHIKQIEWLEEQNRDMRYKIIRLEQYVDAKNAKIVDKLLESVE